MEHRVDNENDRKNENERGPGREREKEREWWIGIENVGENEKEESMNVDKWNRY